MQPHKECMPYRNHLKYYIHKALRLEGYINESRMQLESSGLYARMILKREMGLLP